MVRDVFFRHACNLLPMNEGRYSMKFEWFVARRYLRSPYRPAVLRLVTAFSILGVAAGVATLVIALSMNTGFRETLQDRLLGVKAHVSLARPGTGGIRNYEELIQKFADLPGVKSIVPSVYQNVLLSFGGDARGVVAKGVDPDGSGNTMRRCSGLSPASSISLAMPTASKRF